MPFDTKQQKKVWDAAHYAKHRAERDAKSAQWRKTHPEECRAIRHRSYLKHKAETAVYAVQYRKTHKKECALKQKRVMLKRRAYLGAIKMERGCCDCGYKGHPAALHFDHIKGVKEMDLSKAYSKKLIEQELAKCVVRCANCHAIRHNALDTPHA